MSEKWIVRAIANDKKNEVHRYFPGIFVSIDSKVYNNRKFLLQN